MPHCSQVGRWRRRSRTGNWPLPIARAADLRGVRHRVHRERARIRMEAEILRGGREEEVVDLPGSGRHRVRQRALRLRPVAFERELPRHAARALAVGDALARIEALHADQVFDPRVVRLEVVVGERPVPARSHRRPDRTRRARRSPPGAGGRTSLRSAPCRRRRTETRAGSGRDTRRRRRSAPRADGSAGPG